MRVAREHAHRRHKVMVDTDTYSVTDIGDDCVAWYGLDSRGLFVACCDHEPLLLQRDPAMGSKISVSGDDLSLGTFRTSISTTKVGAWKQKQLTSDWKAGSLR